MHPSFISNLALMEFSEKYGMQNQIAGESIGGNAGVHEGLPCCAANFRYDPKNGRILSFENFSYSSKERFENALQGTYVLTIPQVLSGDIGGIVRVFLHQDIHSELFMDCARKYNERNATRHYDPKLIIKNSENR